jgi:hypothetical protein
MVRLCIPTYTKNKRQRIIAFTILTKGNIESTYHGEIMWLHIVSVHDQSLGVACGTTSTAMHRHAQRCLKSSLVPRGHTYIKFAESRLRRSRCGGAAIVLE